MASTNPVEERDITIQLIELIRSQLQPTETATVLFSIPVEVVKQHVLILPPKFISFSAGLFWDNHAVKPVHLYSLMMYVITERLKFVPGIDFEIKNTQNEQIMEFLNIFHRYTFSVGKEDKEVDRTDPLVERKLTPNQSILSTIAKSCYAGLDLSDVYSEMIQHSKHDISPVALNHFSICADLLKQAQHHATLACGIQTSFYENGNALEKKFKK